MRQKIAAGNWKMNTSLEEGMNLASEIINMTKDEVRNSAIVILATPFTHLYSVGKLITSHQNISLAAQNCSSKLSGAYTGEISVGMLNSIGVKYVILGHSERRQYFNESNELLKEKVNIVIENGLIPIFCCGESLDQRENTDFIAFVCSQLTESLFHLSPELFKNIVIAYEPIWAIGTGKTASSQQAQDMHLAIRNHIANKYGKDIANDISLLYGGSVGASNAAELFASMAAGSKRLFEVVDPIVNCPARARCGACHYVAFTPQNRHFKRWINEQRIGCYYWHGIHFERVAHKHAWR